MHTDELEQPFFEVYVDEQGNEIVQSIKKELKFN